MAQHKGGVLRLVASGAAGTIDPQVNYEEEFNQIFAFTQDELVTFRKVAGDAGSEIVPDLADSVPAPQDGGRTYVFHLRPGIRFSTGQLLTTDDVVASFRRMFKVSGPNVGSWYNVIVGGDACVKSPADCTLAGGVIGDRAAGTVTIHLVHPDSEFFDQIAMPFAAILPANTPSHDLGTTPPVATGPYMVTKYDPMHEMTFARNPYFVEWNKDSQPAGFADSIIYRYGLQDESETTEVENGQQDWMYDEKPLDRLAEIGSRYTKLAHISPLLAYYYVTMNVRIPPFNKVKARQAVSFALNRRALINLYGGPALGTPICQLLPAGMPGYSPYCPYSKPPGDRWVGPDLARAQALVRESGTAGQKVTLVTSDKEVERTMGIYLQSVLQDIGYQASVHAVSFNIRDPYMENSKNKVQVGLSDWYEDYPTPADFLAVMFSCKTFRPGSDASINMAEFCDPAIEAEMDQALAMGATDPQGALKIWTKVDHEMTDQAPAATIFQVHYLDIVSPRVGNFQFNPLYHVLLSQLWVH